MSISIFGALEGTRTPDLLIRSQALYPAELRARVLKDNIQIIDTFGEKVKHYF